MALLDAEKAVTDSERIENIEKKVDEMYELLQHFKPLLERYQQAANAGSFRQARKAMKGNGQ